MERSSKPVAYAKGHEELSGAHRRASAFVWFEASSAPPCTAPRASKQKRHLPRSMHEARHTYASLMIAAGVNAKALSTFMGHASITITLDRYGHLFPGSEEEAAELLDSYLATTPLGVTS